MDGADEALLDTAAFGGGAGAALGEWVSEAQPDNHPAHVRMIAAVPLLRVALLLDVDDALQCGVVEAEVGVLAGIAEGH